MNKYMVAHYRWKAGYVYWFRRACNARTAFKRIPFGLSYNQHHEAVQAQFADVGYCLDNLSEKQD